MIENSVIEIGAELDKDPDIKSLTITDDIFKLILDQWYSGNKEELRIWLNRIPELLYKFGTREWANENFNTHYACTHGCRYCYAWNEAYQRKRSYWQNWGKKMTLRDYWDKSWMTRKENYIIMYPTTHDITPEIMDKAFIAIQNMLDANIDVLLVSKPHIEVMTALVDKFSDYVKNSPKILPRFSISTNDNELLSFWETGAPRFEERIDCLKLLFNKGFETSVSMEPFFPAKNLNGLDQISVFKQLVKELLKYVRDTLWIGMMNHIPKLICRGRDLKIDEKRSLEHLLLFYKCDNIYDLIQQFYNNPKIRWKESIKKLFINYILEVSI